MDSRDLQGALYGSRPSGYRGGEHGEGPAGEVRQTQVPLLRGQGMMDENPKG